MAEVSDNTVQKKLRALGGAMEQLAVVVVVVLMVVWFVFRPARHAPMVVECMVGPPAIALLRSANMMMWDNTGGSDAGDEIARRGPGTRHQHARRS